VASLAFWTTRVHAVLHLYDRLSFILAGQIAPLSLLPDWLATLSFALPFGYMLWVPSEILRGGMDLNRAAVFVVGQCIWLAVGWIGFVIIWRLGLRQFSAVGA
jgi:ABC-2 type transport system permease protein